MINKIEFFRLLYTPFLLLLFTYLTLNKQVNACQLTFTNKNISDTLADKFQIKLRSIINNKLTILTKQFLLKIYLQNRKKMSRNLQLDFDVVIKNMSGQIGCRIHSN